MQPTVVAGIDISFERLIMIFIKFGLAAVPAAIIVSLVGFAPSAIFDTGFATIGLSHSIQPAPLAMFLPRAG